MKKLSFLAFSAFAYVVFLATFLYLIAFVGGLPILPHGIDHGETHVALPIAAAIDLLLVTIFAVQHSAMARPAFKRWWSKIVPTPLERSAYVLTASGTLIVLFAFWQPIAAPVWSADGIAAAVLWGLFGAGWLVVLISTFLISHFELFGLKQAWLHWCGLAQASPVFRTPWLYKLIRHPLYLGFFLAFWSTPTMTLGHLLFALGMSTFMLVAIRFEERGLVDTFGETYARYRARTGMPLPRLRPAPSSK